MQLGQVYGQSDLYPNKTRCATSNYCTSESLQADGLSRFALTCLLVNIYIFDHSKPEFGLYMYNRKHVYFKGFLSVTKLENFI